MKALRLTVLAYFLACSVMTSAALAVNSVTDGLNLWQPDAGAADANSPQGGASLAPGGATELAGELRRIKSEIRALSNNEPWIRVLGLNSTYAPGSAAPVFVSGTSFTLSGDWTPAGSTTITIRSGQRIKALGVAGGPIYGSVNGTPTVAGGITTIVVTWDSGTLDSGLTEVQLGLSSQTSVAAIKVTKQVFTASGTYTPTAGMLYAMLECVGGGGGGGGAAGSATGISGAGGGGAGSYARALVTAAQVGTSKVVTIGAGGALGTSGNNAGGAGGDTSVGTLCVGKGGSGGAGAGAGLSALGGAGGIAGTGDITPVGNGGMSGVGGSITTISATGGAGAGSIFGGGTVSQVQASGGCVGNSNGGNYGAGGGGAECNGTAATNAGGAGAAGVIYITEFVQP